MDHVLRVDLSAVMRMRDAGITGVQLIRLLDLKRRYEHQRQLRRVSQQQRLQFVKWLVKQGWFTESLPADPAQPPQLT